ncbi:MAG: response regulator [Alphaproteobacteria bacterium]|nr:response regulator [Alphaproteobacteria bacterium]
MVQILVIEDDDIVRELIKSILIDAGYDVTSANNGKEGLKSAISNKPDIVITDIFMPEKEGLETIKELRAHYPDIKILAVSGGGQITMENVLKIAGIFGADMVLKKPFETDVLLEKIKELFLVFSQNVQKNTC